MKNFYTRVSKVIFNSKKQSTLFSKHLVRLVHLGVQVIVKYIKLKENKNGNDMKKSSFELYIYSSLKSSENLDSVWSHKPNRE